MIFRRFNINRRPKARVFYLNSKQYFKKCYENVVNPVSSKVMLVYGLTQDLYMSILQSLWKHFIMVQPSALLTNIRIFKKMNGTNTLAYFVGASAID